MSAAIRLEDLAADDAEAVAACLPVLRVLRPQLGSDADVAAQLARQAAEGYRLLAAVDGDGTVVAFAGWRFAENTVYGRFLYVDDLATAPDLRGSGIGARLIETLTERGKAAGCTRLALDSGVSNQAAHRFYFRAGLTIGAFRFGRALGSS
ncbi:MAG TPA: GNAT family N-acetyltransferase [Aliidongia sp.]|uniref:GNAT family N-acetyltransferase n=1 Tax=Aliidongia sp. TaxID=1914230 RepID=UPI002DDD4814|nr:GNAT family N-acetyltransferase [Aliidongia sp.]HEV2677944.1 GNAT family N-acetyltransferase [Aliidongia sp.]